MSETLLDELQVLHTSVGAAIQKLKELTKVNRPVQILGMTVDLAEGETYVGLIVSADLKTGHHTILLPSDHEELTHSDALVWAKELGGDLPSRPEQALLFANHREQFKKEAYWSNQIHAENSSYTWYQGVGYGVQYYCNAGGKLRARAVRRLVFSL